MKRIQYFPLYYSPGRNEVMMPSGAEVLCVESRNGFLQIHTAIEPTSGVMETRTFVLHGWSDEVEGTYVDSVYHNGVMYHVFEV